MIPYYVYCLYDKYTGRLETITKTRTAKDENKIIKQFCDLDINGIIKIFKITDLSTYYNAEDLDAAIDCVINCDKPENQQFSQFLLETPRTIKCLEQIKEEKNKTFLQKLGINEEVEKTFLRKLGIVIACIIVKLIQLLIIWNPGPMFVLRLIYITFVSTGFGNEIHWSQSMLDTTIVAIHCIMVFLMILDGIFSILLAGGAAALNRKPYPWLIFSMLFGVINASLLLLICECCCKNDNHLEK